MKKFALLVGMFFSMYSYCDESVVSEIQHTNNKLTVEEANQIYNFERKYAEQYGIPVEIGLSISAVESTFKRTAVSSSKQSYGLKQINYQVWGKKYGISKKCLMDTECNIRHGYMIFRYYVDHNNGDIQKALMGYRGSTHHSTNAKYMRKVINNSLRFVA